MCTVCWWILSADCRSCHECCVSSLPVVISVIAGCGVVMVLLLQSGLVHQCEGVYALALYGVALQCWPSISSAFLMSIPEWTFLAVCNILRHSRMFPWLIGFGDALSLH